MSASFLIDKEALAGVVTHAPCPVSAGPSSSSAESSVGKLEEAAGLTMQAEMGVKQHISTSIKSLYRLSKSVGISREEFERLLQTEIAFLEMMDEDEWTNPFTNLPRVTFFPFPFFSEGDGSLLSLASTVNHDNLVGFYFSSLFFIFFFFVYFIGGFEFLPPACRKPGSGQAFARYWLPFTSTPLFSYPPPSLPHFLWSSQHVYFFPTIHFTIIIIPNRPFFLFSGEKYVSRAQGVF